MLGAPWSAAKRCASSYTSESSAAVNRQTGTAKPRSASIAFSSAWRTFSFDRRAVRNRTLPVWMCVSTSSNPAADSASRSSAIGYWRLPTLTARRNAMKVGMTT